MKGFLENTPEQFLPLLSELHVGYCSLLEEQQHWDQEVVSQQPFIDGSSHMEVTVGLVWVALLSHNDDIKLMHWAVVASWRQTWCGAN